MSLTDAELLDYALSHSCTPRRLFHREHVSRLYALAGVFRINDDEWVQIDHSNAERLVALARERAKVESQPAHERRVLLREPDPITAAAIKIAALRRALFVASDTGEMFRASGDVPCLVCGDAYQDHPPLLADEYVVGLCNGRRAKL